MFNDLLTAIRNDNLDEYGSIITVDYVRKFLGIEYPEYATKAEFDELALKELGAIDRVRNKLLDEGKYLKQDGSVYRILLPHENANQIKLLHNSADRKLLRARKLNANTPLIDGERPSQETARVLMKMLSTRRILYR